MEGWEFHVSEGTNNESAGDEGDQKSKRNQDYACIFSV